MNKKLRKVIVLFLALSLCITMLLAGCGGDKKEDAGTQKADDPTEEVVETEEVPEVLEGEITVWGWEAIKAATDVVLPSFNEKYPDITVNFEVMTADDLYQKLLLAFSAGGEGVPDVATIETSNLAQMVRVGELADLTEVVQPYIGKMNDFKWADATMDDKIYAMPWDSGPVGLFYRRDIFEEAGYPSNPEALADVLKTWEDFYEAAKVIKEKTGSYMIAESKEQNSARTFEKLLWQQGKLYFDENGDVDMASAEAVRTLEFLGKLVKEDYVDNTIEWTQPWYDGMNLEGNVATHISAVWMAGFMRSWIAAEASGQWGVIPLPAWEEGGVRTSNDGGSNFAIPKKTESFNLAWAYAEFMLGEIESQIQMFEVSDIFPALETAYDHEVFETEIEYFGGQKLYKVFADLVKDIPAVRYTQNYPMAKEEMENTLVLYYLSDTPASEVLENANERVKTNISN